MTILAILSLVASTPALYLSCLAHRVAYMLTLLTSLSPAHCSFLILVQTRYIMLTTTTNQTLLFLLTINSTDPIYYYCSQTSQIGHCQAGMVGIINPPCDGNGINSSGSFGNYQSAAKLVTSEGPLPSVIWGGQLVSTYPSGTPTGSPGPTFTGFSASCTTGSNSSSNSTTSTTTSVITSATTSVIQPVSSSGGGSVYGSVSFRHQKLLSLIWQAGSLLGLISAVLLAFLVA
ncbi:uncharacterized protein PAC_13884 [Phialocephala subalpina]|uniref:Uncharacterized protein n=1 Tax=Phialocephala subalpina TaxID=576137 RepID=A0A1L7XGB0_9HELO|nr:uncharacterized protein PAC_13884 [Phialocephala subalpina]